MKINYLFVIYFFLHIFNITCFCDDDIDIKVHNHPYFEKQEKNKKDTYDTMLKVFVLSPLSGTLQDALIFLLLVSGAIFFDRKIHNSINTGDNSTNMKFKHAFKWGALIHWFIFTPLYTFIKKYMESWDTSDNLELYEKINI